jgi:hypothetical protein
MLRRTNRVLDETEEAIHNAQWARVRDRAHNILALDAAVVGEGAAAQGDIEGLVSAKGHAHSYAK